MKSYTKYGLIWIFELLITIIFTFAAVTYIKNILTESRLALQHTNLVVNYVNSIRISLLRLETGQRGYNIPIAQKYLKPYNIGLSNIHTNVNKLEKITYEDIVQHNRVLRLKEYIDLKLKELNLTIQLRKHGKYNEAVAEISKDIGVYFMNECQDTLAEILDTESKALEQRNSNEDKSFKIMQLGIPFVVFVNFSMLILAYFLIKEEESRSNG